MASMFSRIRLPGFFVPFMLFLSSVLAQNPKPQQPVADFQDVAQKAGLNFEIVSGNKETKKYIIETTGTGIAIFDYDNDGWPDIFIVNGTTLEAATSTKAATNHLYRNNYDGTFTDVTVKSGLEATGW